MRPINIFALTRLTESAVLSRLERQMSGRRRPLKIREWETDGLRSFCAGLGQVTEAVYGMEFYYSFVMPKLGKEFDLLRIGEDEIVNIELKSGNVTDEAIKKQLTQNRYYLSTLGKPAYFYTYVSGSDRLLRLTGGGRLMDASWQELADTLARQRNLYTGPIEELFREDLYLISPMTDPDRFLRGDYFLTSQQRDIEKQILRGIANQSKTDAPPRFGFSGYPGTGKTLLLYDIAMHLSEKEPVCLFHLGPANAELTQLDSRLKRIDFYYEDTDLSVLKKKTYFAILVDEGHFLTPSLLDGILRLSDLWKAPVIVSYNKEDVISEKENTQNGAALLAHLDKFHARSLTNRIRLNNELAQFIRNICHPQHHMDSPSVSVVYANDPWESGLLLRDYMEKGYTYLRTDADPDCSAVTGSADSDREKMIPVASALTKEFDSVVMKVDKHFYYDEGGNLRYDSNKTAIPFASEVNAVSFGEAAKPSQDSPVRHLFHGLSRAKKQIALVVEGNEAVFMVLLGILQK